MCSLPDSVSSRFSLGDSEFQDSENRNKVNNDGRIPSTFTASSFRLNNKPIEQERQ